MGENKDNGPTLPEGLSENDPEVRLVDEKARNARDSFNAFRMSTDGLNEIQRSAAGLSEEDITTLTRAAQILNRLADKV